MASNKRGREEDIHMDEEDVILVEHAPASKKAKGGGGLQSAFESFFSNLKLEKNRLEREKKALAAEKKAWDKTAKKLPRVVTQSRVKLNVGGVRFETSPDTLRAHGGSFFDDMLSGRLHLTPGDDGFYFIDRQPTHFQLVLNFLRGMKINLWSLPVPVVESLKTEAEFYRLNRLVHQIKEVLRPVFSPGPNYSVHSGWHIVTKTGDACWDATVLGPLVSAGVSTRVRIVRSSFVSNILIGLGPTYIPQRQMNFGAPECHMLNCFDGNLLTNGVTIPYYGYRIAAPSIVEVQVDNYGDVYFAIDGVKQAKAFSVATNKFYRLLVLMYAPGDRVKLL